MKLFERHPIPFFLLIILVYFLGIPVDIMEIDSAQYANIAREMIWRGEYLEVLDQGKEYLDKPPFIFWISAFFYLIFGVNEFAFKLPAILFSCLGIYSVYRLTLLNYPRRTALLAALFLATTQGYFHFNNDVRTDNYLTNSVITAVWLLAEFLRSGKHRYWIGGFIFIGIGMLAKGPMGLVAPGCALGIHVVATRQWKLIFKWQWLAGIIVSLLVLSPMLWGLYAQFDLQPDKIVNDRTGVSGIRFFFWEQSFGRITGENVWKNDTGPFFFVHSMAWSFMPWFLFFVGGLGMKAGELFRKNDTTTSEFISLGGFLLPFVALSMSHYKLPHYIYVTFPFASILAANYAETLAGKVALAGKVIYGLQSFILLAALGLLVFVISYYFPAPPAFIGLFVIAALTILVAVLRAPRSVGKLIVISAASVFLINIAINTVVYPAIMEYQAPSVAGKYLSTLEELPENVYYLNTGGRSLEFYINRPVQQLNDVQNLRAGDIVYTNVEGLSSIINSGYSIKVHRVLYNYSITLLSLRFADPATRSETLKEEYLIEIR